MKRLPYGGWDGVRDYIHVMDLADGHVAALQKVGNQAGLHCYNLGTGTAPVFCKCYMHLKKQLEKPFLM